MYLDNLYNIISANKQEVLICLDNENHPIFKAHFPSNPILPAFIHFEIISEIFNINITQIKKAKFIEVVKPSQILNYKRDENRYSVFVDEKQVATFSL